MKNNTSLLADDRYFNHLAAAFVRGQLSLNAGLSDTETIRQGLAQGLRLHKFKRQSLLPRVKRVIGLLRGISPANLLDIGSGRGTFLWPMLDTFPNLEVTAIDQNPIRVRDIEAVRGGGCKNLQAFEMDAHKLVLNDDEFDVVTMLEVLEHLPNPALAAREAIRVAQRFVIVTVPSTADENPEHIHLFNEHTLTNLWQTAGARKVTLDFILNHIVALAHC